MDGTSSYDVDGDMLTYEWSLVSKPHGSETSFSDPTAPTPSFTMDSSGSYVVQLVVHDGAMTSDPDIVVIATHNSQPVANPGQNKQVQMGELVNLDGSRSYDADHQSLTHEWSFTVVPQGSMATFSDPTANRPMFLPDLEGLYVAQLIVNDGTVDSVPETVTVSVGQGANGFDLTSVSSSLSAGDTNPSFSVSPLKGRAPLTVTFANESAGPIADWKWEFRDGEVSTEQHPTHTFEKPGAYQARLTVTGQDGAKASVEGPMITVYPSDGAILLFEPFNDAALPDWQVVDEGKWQGPSQWTAVTGSLQQTSNIWSPPADPTLLPKLGTYLLYKPGMEWEAYRITATLRSHDDDAIGVMFRYQDDRNYYRFSWDRERGYRRLVKQVDGVFVSLAEDRVPYEPDQDYEVAILASREFVEVQIEEKVIFGGPIQDTSLVKGSIALYSWFNTGGAFDDLIVTSMEDTSESASLAREETVEHGEDTR